MLPKERFGATTLTSGQRKTPPERGFRKAAEGARTLDLLHGKQTL
jgi:hypothetical protein